LIPACNELKHAAAWPLNKRLAFSLVPWPMAAGYKGYQICLVLYSSMHKFIVFVVALIYLAFASGATMHMHYCMGTLVDAGLKHKPAKTCSKCGMEKKANKNNGCCKDEQKFVQLDKDQKTTAQQFFNLKILASSPVVHSEIDATLLAQPLAERFPISHAPPLLSSTDIYARNCVFLI
jgi:hypothetical protein